MSVERPRTPPGSTGEVPADVLRQYGCGPIPFVATDHGLYDRHLVVDNVVDPAGTALAGEPITAKLTRAAGNQAPIGGLKVLAARGWFAARPSETENIYKIDAESLRDQTHLDAIVSEAQAIVSRALGSSGSVA